MMPIQTLNIYLMSPQNLFCKSTAFNTNDFAQAPDPSLCSIPTQHLAPLRLAPLVTKTAMLFKFACYFLAEGPILFTIDILSDDWVVELPKAIKGKLKSQEVICRPLPLQDKLVFLWQTAN